MAKAYVFPGQGAQFVGMGKDLYESNLKAKELFDKANEILGYRITDIMFNGTDEDLKQTKVTQPAVFLHSVITALCMDDFKPDMVAGHSLGEFSALVAAGALTFEDGLRLVYARAMAMQKACEAQPSTMAAIINLPDETIEQVCADISKGGQVVVPANYNSPGQVVISGDVEAINEACSRLKEAGAKRALPLAVGGAFHSPLMEPARIELAAAIEKAPVSKPICPVFQNVDAKPHTDPVEIKENLLKQLTAPVRWTQSVINMINDGMTEFVECGPGQVLTGLIGRIQNSLTLVSVIIPVYQVSDYVERCLVSVMNQTYKGIECIIVNDATQDDSIEKCERLIEKYSGPIQFRILHHEKNRGLSAARNTGTDAALGDYLYYLDSDDEITTDCIEKLINVAQADSNADMIIGNNWVKDIDGSERIVIEENIPFHIQTNETIVSYYHHQQIPVSAWNKLIKHSFIKDNNLYFKEGIVVEDYMWMFHVMKYLKEVYVLKDVTYHYYLRPGSIMTVHDEQAFANSYCAIYDDILHHLTTGREKQELTRYVEGFCNCYLKYISIIPVYQDLYELYRKQAVRYGCTYVKILLSSLTILRHFNNPFSILGRMNEMRWKVKFLIVNKRLHYNKK